jgi:multiple sugar transport system permease protein
MTARSVEAPTQAAPEAKPRRPAKAPLSERARAERRLGWMLCAPAVIVMLAVTAYPIGYAIYLSLQRYDLRFPAAKEFVGFANYATVLGDSLWWTAFGITVLIVVVSVGIEFVLGMALALIMRWALLGRGAVRTAILVPYGIVTVVAAYSWQVDLGRALLLLAGLSLVPEELLRAAKVDGATGWQRFTRIMLPLMKPAILVALLFRTLDAFRIFDNIFILTSGANDTRSVSILGYDNLFTALNLGIGSTISVLIFIAVAIIAFVFVKGFGTAAPGQEVGRR